jgi:hypothetical protein
MRNHGAANSTTYLAASLLSLKIICLDHFFVLQLLKSLLLQCQLKLEIGFKILS